MITKEQLQETFDKKQKEFARALKQFRIDANIRSPFVASKELRLGRDTVYLAEASKRVPTPSTLTLILSLYSITKSAEIYMHNLRDELYELRETIRELD